MIMRREREKGEKRGGEQEREREENLKCQSMNSNTIIGIAVAFLGCV